MFVVQWLVISVLVGALSIWLVHPSAPHEPWGHRLACVVPLSLIVGLVLAVVGEA